MAEPIARVLIAEGDSTLRRYLFKKLLDLDVFSDTAADGQEALERLAEQTYAVVLLDVELPAGDAVAILERVASMEKRVRPVILAMVADSYGNVLDMDVVQVVLRKPFHVGQIAQVVQSCIRSVESKRTTTGSPAAEPAPDDPRPAT